MGSLGAFFFFLSSLSHFATPSLVLPEITLQTHYTQVLSLVLLGGTQTNRDGLLFGSETITHSPELFLQPGPQRADLHLAYNKEVPS